MQPCTPLKASLISTTALIGVSVCLLPTPSLAACGSGSTATVTVNTVVASAPAVANCNTLSVTGAGAINAGAGTAFHLGIQLYNVTNAGTISSAAGNAIFLTSAASITNGVTNSGTISATSGFGILLKSGGNISGGVTNSAGIISGTGSGILIENGSRITGKITNSVTIVGADGIQLTGGSTLDGIVNNASGIIDGTAGSGISLKSGVTLSGGVSNSGIIEATSGAGVNGILIGQTSTLSGGILNNSSSTIQGVGSGAGNAGIAIATGGAVTGKITNSGILEDTAGTASGIIVTGSNSALDGIVNSSGGTIESVGGAGVLIAAGGAVSGNLSNSALIEGTTGIKVAGANSALNGIVNNTGGTIESTGASNGIYIATGGVVTGKIANSGLIEGTTAIRLIGASSSLDGIVNNTAGTIEGTGAGNYGILAGTGATLTGSITNSGLIEGGTAIRLVGSGSSLNGIVNNANATIEGTGAGSYSIWAGTASALTGKITNSGLIEGVTAINISGGSSVDGIVNNAGATIQGTGGTAIALSGLTASTPITINGGQIIGDVTDAAPSGGHSPVEIAGNFTTQSNFTVSGMTVDSGKTLTIAAGNTVTLNAMPASTGGTFDFAVNSSASHGTLAVSGAGNGINLTGATVAVDAGAGVSLTNGTQILLGQGNAAVSGITGTKITVSDNSVLWNFQIANGTAATNPAGTPANDLYLFVSSDASVYTTAASAAAAAALQELSATTNPQLQEVVTNFNNASSSAALNRIVQSVQPPVNGAAFIGSQQFSGKTFDVADVRLSTLTGNRFTGISSGDEAAGVHNAWIQGFGQAMDQGLRDGIPGFSATTAGFAFGADTSEIVDDAVIGLSFSYGGTQVTADDVNDTKTRVGSYQLTLYSNYDLGNYFYIRGMLAYARDTNDMLRHDVGGTPGLNADGSFAANQYTSRLETGKTLNYNNTTVTPRLLADYIYYNPENYTETGAGGADLHVSQKDLQNLDVGLGIEVQQSYIIEDGGKLTPEIGGGYRFNIVNDAISSTSNFTGGGTAISSTGSSPARSSVNFGTGVTYSATNTLDFKLRYDYEYKSTYHANSVFAQINYRF